MTIQSINVRNQLKGTIQEIVKVMWFLKSM